MKVIAINGSPRKNGNTAALLEHAMNGCRSQGAQTKRIDLYHLNYKGCMSCFFCKRKDTPHSPVDCQAAYALGVHLVKKGSETQLLR